MEIDVGSTTAAGSGTGRSGVLGIHTIDGIVGGRAQLSGNITTAAERRKIHQRGEVPSVDRHLSQ